jgi:hypothetical protein
MNKKTYTFPLTLALMALTPACASVSETHEEQEVLIRELARRPISEEIAHEVSATFAGEQPMSSAELVVQVTEEVTCHDVLVDIYEEQRHTTRTINDPLYPASFALGGALLGACSGMHVAGIGCVSPADAEDGTPAAPYTRDQHNAAAISFGLLSATAIGVFVVDLVRSRDSVEVLERTEKINHKESTVCRREPLADHTVSLTFADAGLAALSAQTDGEGVARFDLSGLVAREEALWEDTSVAVVRTAHHEQTLGALPETWQQARRDYFEAQAWTRATDASQIPAYMAFLERYPESAHARLAHAWLLPSLEERGQPADIARYLERYPKTSRTKLEQRYLATRTTQMLAEYAQAWQDTARTRRILEQEPAFALQGLSEAIITWHHEAFAAIDESDVEARWAQALALWKLGEALHADAVKIEAPAVVIATQEYEAITTSGSARPLTPLVARITTLHEQSRAEITRRGFARTLLNHERTQASEAIEEQRTPQAHEHITRALGYARELDGPDEALLVLSRKVDASRARLLISEVAEGADYQTYSTALTQALLLTRDEAVKLELMRATIDGVAPMLLPRILRGEDLDALLGLVAGHKKAHSHLVSTLLDEMLATAALLGEQDIAGNVTEWRGLLEQAEHLTGEDRALNKRLAKAKKKLYPITHQDAEDVLGKPRGHKDARLIVAGKVEREVGSQYIFRTEQGTLLFIKPRGKTARRVLSSSRPVGLYIIVTGTIAYEQEGRTLRLATADAIIGVR